jgi:hypothetical protein
LALVLKICRNRFSCHSCPIVATRWTIHGPPRRGGGLERFCQPLSFWAVKPLRPGSGYKACLFVEATERCFTLAGSGDRAPQGLL